MSSLLEGNPYAEAHRVSATEGEDNEHWALAQAILALTYEVRTANILGLQVHLLGLGDYYAVNDIDREVAARMGSTID